MNNIKGIDWLGNNQEINNPYFGSSTLKCGLVQKKLKLHFKNQSITFIG